MRTPVDRLMLGQARAEVAELRAQNKRLGVHALECQDETKALRAEVERLQGVLAEVNAHALAKMQETAAANALLERGHRPFENRDDYLAWDKDVAAHLAAQPATAPDAGWTEVEPGVFRSDPITPNSSGRVFLLRAALQPPMPTPPCQESGVHSDCDCEDPGEVGYGVTSQDQVDSAARKAIDWAKERLQQPATVPARTEADKEAERQETGVHPDEWEREAAMHLVKDADRRVLEAMAAAPQRALERVRSDWDGTRDPPWAHRAAVAELARREGK